MTATFTIMLTVDLDDVADDMWERGDDLTDAKIDARINEAVERVYESASTDVTSQHRARVRAAFARIAAAEERPAAS